MVSTPFLLEISEKDKGTKIYANATTVSQEKQFFF
jgi:hypothetical protein